MKRERGVKSSCGEALPSYYGAACSELLATRTLEAGPYPLLYVMHVHTWCEGRCE